MVHTVERIETIESYVATRVDKSQNKIERKERKGELTIDDILH